MPPPPRRVNTLQARWQHPPSLSRFPFSTLQQRGGISNSSNGVTSSAGNMPHSCSLVGDQSTSASLSFSPSFVPLSCSSSNSITTISQSNKESSICTSLVTFNPSNHGHQRRVQRNIGIRDLQAAKKYGFRTPGRPDSRTGNPRSLYTYRGIRYIVDDITGHEITSYALPTQLQKRNLSQEEQRRHEKAQANINQNRSCWTSHTVLLVDKSGSMRQSDVTDSKNRYQSTWCALARDYISLRIESGFATDYDVVSIVVFGNEPYTLVECVPTDWNLYNLIVDVYNQRSISKNMPKSLLRPSGHGNFLPALVCAHKLLEKTVSQSSTTLALAILSDGRPSDYKGNSITSRKAILESMESIASKFGKRLSVHGIGMGSADQFDILREVATVVQEYSCQGDFSVPALSSAGLGVAFSSLATSVTESTQLINRDESSAPGATTKAKVMRQVFREKACNVPYLTEAVDSQDFDIYMGSSVTRAVYKRDAKTFEFAPLQNEDAHGVAIKKVAFGEGGERLAFQFFELASDGETVVGDPLVAKLSRFIEEGEMDFPDIEAEADENGARSKWSARDRFVKKFCERQNAALAVAIEFNKKLDLIKKLDPDTPRVSFLDCSVYYVQKDGDAESALLVERKLDGKFTKWNGNNGFVRQSQTPVPKSTKRSQAMMSSIPEDDEAEVIDVDELPDEEFIFVTPSEVAQAFSHFSFFNSERKMLLCDLQGEYDKRENMFCFTDPVVHYYDRHNPGKRSLYGRTDLGRKGIEKFFDNHRCNRLCELVTRGFRIACDRKRQKQN